MTDKMPQWIAFCIAICMCITAAVFFWRYQDIHSTHTQVAGKVVSFQSRSTPINENSIRKLYHLIATIPLEGEEHALILKEGSAKRPYNKGDNVALIYPNGNIEDIRLQQPTDKIWPTLLAALMGGIALYAGGIFRKEANNLAGQELENKA